MEAIAPTNDLPLALSEFKGQIEDHPTDMSKDQTEKNSSTDSTLSKVKLDINAYKRRNVYKSIIRRMSSYLEHSKESIRNFLKTNGFSLNEIEDAFQYVFQLKELDKQKGKSKRPQNTINMMLQKKSIYTYILNETLGSMIDFWNGGKTGKLRPANVLIYKEVCEKYYARSCQLIREVSES